MKTIDFIDHRDAEIWRDKCERRDRWMMCAVMGLALLAVATFWAVVAYCWVGWP